jgi:hypothetical protein
MRRGTCGRGPEGSGYVKPRDQQKAAEVENAYAAILASRATLDSFWKADDAIPVYQHVPYDPNGSNAQPGWPGNEVDSLEEFTVEEFTGIDDNVKYIEILDVSGFAVEPVPLEFDEGEFDVITYAEDVPDTTKTIDQLALPDGSNRSMALPDGSNRSIDRLALNGSNRSIDRLTQSPLLPLQSPPQAVHPPQ